MRRRFNSTLALSFFKDNYEAGVKYSHRVQFFSVVDTLEDNYFAPISSELVPFIVKYMQTLYPTTFEAVFKDALNIRLGVEN